MKALTGKSNQKRTQIEAMPETTFDEIGYNKTAISFGFRRGYRSGYGKDKILLARDSNFPGSWHYLIAGCADAGESLEETLLREVKEEVRLDIRIIRYYKSQPLPLSVSRMVGFFFI